MFATIGRTWGFVKSSWGVLQQDRELLLFPVFSMIAVGIVIAIFGSIALATGSFDRLQVMLDNDPAATGESINVLDITLYVLGMVSGYFVAIYFNSALVAAAIERLRGGDPTIGSGLRAINPHVFNILGWAIIAASVGIILQVIRSRTDNMIGRIMLSIVGGVWAYMTFFVVPVLVVRGLSPVGAIKESATLFKRTWGEQVSSNIGFGIFYLGAAAIAFLPAALIFTINPIAGIIVGVVLIFFAMSVVAALEGIFKAALYEYAAEGRTGGPFDARELRDSYVPKR